MPPSLTGPRLAPPSVVDVAPNGLAAGEAMLRHWPQYVLVDMEMPHRNGLDTVRWIREHLPQETRIRVGQKSAWYEADIRAFLEGRRSAV